MFDDNQKSAPYRQACHKSPETVIEKIKLYTVDSLTNIIGAPFYGLLAEKVEQRLYNILIPEESLNHMIIRTLKREMVKLWYFISRGIVVSIGLFVLAFIPVLNLLTPLLAFIWTAWVLALQYADYPADNHQISFVQLRQRLKQQKYTTLGFGSTVMLGSLVPVVNIVIMPVAVAGGAVFWVKELSIANRL